MAKKPSRKLQCQVGKSYATKEEAQTAAGEDGEVTNCHRGRHFHVKGANSRRAKRAKRA